LPEYQTALRKIEAIKSKQQSAGLPGYKTTNLISCHDQHWTILPNKDRKWKEALPQYKWTKMIRVKDKL
jgi:hypothetical protein